MREKKLWQILVLGIIFLGLTGCATHQVAQVQYQSPTLPAVIKQPSLSEAEKENIPKQVTEELSGQPKISNLWEEVDLRVALHDIAAQAEANIVCDETVEGTITLELKEVPMEKALKMVLQSGGYVFKKIDEDHYLVGSGAPGSPSALTLSQTEMVITNRPAEEVVGLLSPDLTLFVRATKEGYSLSITAPPEIIERVKRDISVIDSTEPLIVIEALITEVRQNKGTSTGIDWSEILDLNASGSIDLKRGAEWAYTGVLKGNLVSSLQILAQQGGLNLKARPNIVTRNGETARINVTKQRYVSLYESGPKSVEGPYYYYYSRFEAKPIESGVLLKVTPRLSREGEIVLDLEAEVSDMDQSTNSNELPVVEKRGAQTTVRVKSGETVVLGGLYQESSQEVRRGIPGLSRIPILNFFFQRKKVETEKTELVIFVTPRVLSPSP